MLDLLVYGHNRPSRKVVPTTTAATTTVAAPQAFAITGVSAPAPGSYSAHIVWTTTEPAAATLQWGPTGMQPLLWADAPHSTTTHDVTLDALAANTSYTVSLTAQSIGGARAATTLNFRTAAAPTSVSASTDNGTIRVNGGAFFPLISWKACPDHWALSVADGINLFGGNECTGLSALTAGIAGQALAAGTAEDAPADAPSLIGWFYPDEADARGLTTLAPTGAGLHLLTLTQHFFSGAAPLPAGRGMYPGLISAADVVGFDLYPIVKFCGRVPLLDVYRAQRELATVYAPGKPTFQWIETGSMTGECPTITITPAMANAEAWLAVAGGADGIGWFTSGWTPDGWNRWDVSPAMLAELAATDAQLTALAPVLLAPVGTVATPAGSTVAASSRTVGGTVYVIAVNASAAPATAVLRVDGLDGRSLVPLGESRLLRPTKRVLLRDTFGPYEVRIYHS